MHNRRDHDVSFAEFMNHLDFAEPYASVSGQYFDILSL